MSSPPLSISPRWVNRVRSSSSPPPSSSHIVDAVWPGDVKPTLGFLKKSPRRVRSISTPPEFLSEEPVRVDSTHSAMNLAPIQESSDKEGREMYSNDSSPNYSPVPGQGTDQDHAELFDKDSLRPISKFQAPRSRSEGKLNTTGDGYSTTTAAPSKLSKRESLKAQKKNYRREKKRVTKELLSALKDPSIIVMADHLKVRGTLKSWTKLWCVLKPGLLIIYKSPKHGQWVGTILLNNCELIERPSRKDGFCFKIYHPLDQSIWATRGPKGENMGSITQPLPSQYLIFRAPSEAAGKCWMDALELALRCSSLLMRSMRDGTTLDPTVISQSFSKERGLNESEIENTHFKHEGLDDISADNESDNDQDSKSESDLSELEEVGTIDSPTRTHNETTYQVNKAEELGLDSSQTETLEDENKGLIWMLVKQVRPGMDLSKVVLPTFILEPRSFLDKLSDFYYHADLLSQSLLEDDPFSRMKQVARWYLSGFYKKPKGLKKPYNPIIGEVFRCLWTHPKTKSQTFYIAEQVSHHPPVTAFYITNRKDGFCISGSILAKSKFYGNSVTAGMDGLATLSFLTRGEDYHITMPYANCKGILYGTLTMEYGGRISIECDKTGYKTELEFKLKPFLGGSDSSNQIVGKIKFGKETLATLEGHWDDKVYIRDKRTGNAELFWVVSQDVKASRLLRSTVAVEEQSDRESEKLWSRVTDSLARGEIQEATNEKFVLEEEQRKGHKERKIKMVEWIPRLFERDEITRDWVYKHMDNRPWDPLNDIEQFEHNGIIQTRTRHKTSILRTTSIISLPHKNGPLEKRLKRNASLRHKKLSGSRPVIAAPSGSGDSECSTPQEKDSDDEMTEDEFTSGKTVKGDTALRGGALPIDQTILPMVEGQKRIEEELKAINSRLAVMIRQSRREDGSESALLSREMIIIAAVLLLGQLIVGFLFRS
ncbi:oxysterol-binding protein-related protein 8-like isoform X2 [Asterias amurensis]|uniref:oxysterol-binding protein-related protein 8-like isoform X2 n=1 Tax=Asterias amurensis TaxID=7602 RepID=UPI003AB8154B